MLRQRAKIAAHARLGRNGAITGRVVGFDGRPVAGACVTAVGRAGSVTAAAAPDGSFRLAHLATGSYALEYRDCSAAGRNLTSASGYLTTWSGGTSAQTSAARVQVGAGQVRHVPVMMLRPANPAAAIAARQASFRRELAANSRSIGVAATTKTGKITGKVTGKGKALRRICVEVVPASGNGQGFGAVTGKRGTYTVRHVVAGRYHVIFAPVFFCPGQGNWLQQVYKNDNNPFAGFGDGGTVVRVRAGHKVTGINAKLRLGGEISGTVTSRSGAKLRGICVSVEGSLGHEDFLGFESRTAANGSYHLHALFPGKYFLQFSIGCGSRGSNYAPATHRPVKIRLGQKRTVNETLAPGASITGTVRLTSSSGTPLGGICVDASNASGSVGGFASTNSHGVYRVIGLTGARFQLQFSPGCSKNPGNYTTTFVTTHTKAGRETSGVDAILQAGGTISGVVTNSHRKPVSGICIQLDGANSDTAVLPDSTGDDGSYSIIGLSAGTYEVGFSGGCGNSGNYAPTWYQNQTDESTATPVTLTTGGTQPVNQRMLPGAIITGTVTDASGHRLSGVCVEAATEDEAAFGPGFAEEFASTEHGTYTISGLAPGQYLIDFGCGASSKYADQWFPGAPDAGSANLIWAGVGRTTGINAVLHLGGSISGVVTNKAGHPLAGVCVSANRLPMGTGGLFVVIGDVGGPVTGSRGTYKISGLAPGRYDVSFSPCDGSQQYVQQSATAVRVRAGKTTSGIDGRLAVGGTMSGSVVNASGAPLRNICVFASNDSTGSFGFATTNKAGTYRARGLSTGSYSVEFSPCGEQNYVSVFRTARVTAPRATTRVNATMQRGGSIAGVVTEGSASGTPVSFVCVDAVSSDPNNPGGFGGTGPDGSYLVTGLKAGTYQVYFDPTCLFGPGLAPQWYDGQPTQATANPVTVSVNQTVTSINAALQPSSTGKITGTVSGKSTGPLSGACVTAVPLPAGSGLPVVAVTRPKGYTLGDLAPGRYKVKFSAGCGAVGYATQWWRQKTSQKTATVIRVGPGQDKSGISATLSKSG